MPAAPREGLSEPGEIELTEVKKSYLRLCPLRQPSLSSCVLPALLQIEILPLSVLDRKKQSLSHSGISPSLVKFPVYFKQWATSIFGLLALKNKNFPNGSSLYSWCFLSLNNFCALTSAKTFLPASCSKCARFVPGQVCLPLQELSVYMLVPIHLCIFRAWHTCLAPSKW